MDVVDSPSRDRVVERTRHRIHAGATIISVRFPSDTIHVGTATVLVTSP